MYFPNDSINGELLYQASKTKPRDFQSISLYGLGIIVDLRGLGLAVSVIFGSDALNQMATNPWFNLAFFALFVILRPSFFGAFEITLPSSWVNKADDASNKGGFLGIFFMAFTLSLVSFSCTGPIIGSLLVEAASKGSLLGPAVGMFGFALALAIPFTLFAAFPGWLNSLPSSGGWLNTVKVTLGFLELAFALKFLSTADLVWQAHLLERELFIAIWVAIAFMTAFYLLGAFRMPLDSPVQTISVSRMGFAMVFMIMAFYMLPGIFGAPVKLIAGFPPPEHYAESKNGAFAQPVIQVAGLQKLQHIQRSLASIVQITRLVSMILKPDLPMQKRWVNLSCLTLRVGAVSTAAKWKKMYGKTSAFISVFAIMLCLFHFMWMNEPIFQRMSNM